MIGVDPATARQLTLAEVGAYAEAIDREQTAARLAVARARQRHA